MLCAAGLIIISVQTHEDVLQSDSFSPSSVCTKWWSSGAVCKSSAPPQSAAQLTTRDVKQSRRETRRCLRIKERNNRTTRWCKNPPKEAKRSKQSKTNKKKWHIMNTNNASCEGGFFYMLVLRGPLSHCLSPWLRAGPTGGTMAQHENESPKKTPATKSLQLFYRFYLEIHMIRRSNTVGCNQSAPSNTVTPAANHTQTTNTFMVRIIPANLL